MAKADPGRERYYYVVPGECRRSIPVEHCATPEARRVFAAAQAGATLIVRGVGAPSKGEFVVDQRITTGDPVVQKIVDKLYG